MIRNETNLVSPRIINIFIAIGRSGKIGSMGVRGNVAVSVRSTLRLLPQPTSAGAQDVDLQEVARRLAEIARPSMPSPGLLAPKGMHYIDSESVLLLNVSLPKMAAAQRRAAVAFATEDLIAQPLDQVHVVLGPEGRGDGFAGSWLVAVVSNAVMADFIAAHPENNGVVLPDVLALQVPDAGDWCVLAQDNRILVRLPDRSGFATTPVMLPVLWAAGGSPRIILLGGELPTDIPVAVHAQLAAAPDPVLMAFDLRSGRFARRGAGWPKGARTVGIIIGLAVFGHLALLGLDVIGLSRIAATREAALRTALEAKGQVSAGDLDTALTAALASRQSPTSGSFLPFLAQAFGAIAPLTGDVQIKDMRFVQAQNSLSLTVEAPNLTALQTAETALVNAGLQVDTGAATTGNGAAEAQMTLRRAAP